VSEAASVDGSCPDTLPAAVANERPRQSSSAGEMVKMKDSPVSPSQRKTIPEVIFSFLVERRLGSPPHFTIFTAAFGFGVGMRNANWHLRFGG